MILYEISSSGSQSHATPIQSFFVPTTASNNSSIIFARFVVIHKSKFVTKLVFSFSIRSLQSKYLMKHMRRQSPSSGLMFAVTFIKLHFAEHISEVIKDVVKLALEASMRSAFVSYGFVSYDLISGLKFDIYLVF